MGVMDELVAGSIPLSLSVASMGVRLALSSGKGALPIEFPSGDAIVFRDLEISPHSDRFISPR